MVFSSPQKQLETFIKKIEKGQGNPKIADSMKKTLSEHPEVTEETALQLIGLIQTDNTDSYAHAVDVLLKIAETDPVLLQNSPEVFIKLIRQPEDVPDVKTMLKVLEIISIIALINTDMLKPAILPLLKKLNDANSSIRSASYYILDIIAKPHPEFFSDNTLDLIRGLHGLNIDERVYAAKLIGEIAAGSPNVIEEAYEVLNDLAYKHPDNRVRAAAYDVLKKFNVEKPAEEESDEKLEFETDFIGLSEVSEQSNDFEDIADELTDRIKGINFEQSASEMLNSMGMGHLIVKPQLNKSGDKAPKKKTVQLKDEKKTPKVADKENNDSGFYGIEQITAFKVDEAHAEPDIETKPDLPFINIGQLVNDPDIKSRISAVKDISIETDLENDIETDMESVEIPEKNVVGMELPVDKTATLTSNQPGHGQVDAAAAHVKYDSSILPDQLTDITVEMVYAIFSELSNEDWISNVALATGEGQLITASDPGSLDETILKKICDMLNLEKSMSKKEGTRSRVKIELSDHLLVALSLNCGFVLIAFSRPDVQFENVLYKLNRTSEKLERIIG